MSGRQQAVAQALRTALQFRSGLWIRRDKERLLLRTVPKGNPRSTLSALPQPESRRGRSTATGLCGYPSSGGTGGSNPLSSSGESTSAGQSQRDLGDNLFGDAVNIAARSEALV